MFLIFFGVLDFLNFFWSFLKFLRFLGFFQILRFLTTSECCGIFWIFLWIIRVLFNFFFVAIFAFFKTCLAFEFFWDFLGFLCWLLLDTKDGIFAQRLKAEALRRS